MVVHIDPDDSRHDFGNPRIDCFARGMQPRRPKQHRAASPTVVVKNSRRETIFFIPPVLGSSYSGCKPEFLRRSASNSFEGASVSKFAYR